MARAGTKLSKSMQKTESTLFSKLRDILFQEEQQTLAELSQEVDELKGSVSESALQARMEAHFEEKLGYLQQHFPALFGSFVTQAIKVQIRESQGEVIDALYPIIGKLISKYIRAELEKLNQRIETQLDQAFSFSGIWLRIKAFFSGVKYEEIILNQSAEQDARVEEVFLIAQDSGLLLGHYSANQLMDADMIAGMLTGIKSFVEHAFQGDQQDLETLEYEQYQIKIHNFKTFFVACVLSGHIFPDFEEKLRAHILDFRQQHPISVQEPISQASTQQYSEALTAHFYGFNQMDQ